jgi:hypothetical protein
MNRVKSVGKYFLRIIISAPFIATGLIDVLGLIINVLGKELNLPTWVYGAILGFGYLVENIRIFLELQDAKIERGIATVEHEVEKVSFGGTGWGILPATPLRAVIKLELRNSGGERAQITKLSIEYFETNTALFTYQPDNLEIFMLPPHVKPNRNKERITLPFDIPARDWRGLLVEVGVRLNETDKEKFIKHVKELKDFELELEYVYRDMDGEIYSSFEKISESYEDFRNDVLQNLIERNQHELVCLLKGMRD